MLQTGEVIPPHYPTEYISSTTYTISGHLGAYISTASAPATWTLPTLSDLLDGSELLIYNQGTHDLTIQAPQSIGDETEIVIAPSSSSRLITTATKWLPSTSSSSPASSIPTAPLIDASLPNYSIATLSNGGLFSRPRSGWEWAITSASSPSSDISTNMTTINLPSSEYHNCIAITGTFTSTLTLGSTVLTAISPRDIFLACLRPNPIPGEPPTFLWAKNYGANTDEGLVPKIFWYETGEILFLVAHYKGNNVDFGDGWIVPNSAYNAGVVTEVTPNGTTTQFYTAIGNNNVVITNAHIANGVYVVINTTASTIIFEADYIQLNSTPDTNQRLVVACFRDWEWTWAVASSSTTMVNVTSVYEHNSYVWITGEFNGTLTCGSQSITSPNSQPSMFVAFTNTSGAWQNKLVRLDTTGDTIRPYNMFFLDSSVYFVGAFDGIASFGDKTLNSNGDLDVFVVKSTSDYTSFNTTYDWALKGGGIAADTGICVISNGNDSIYIAGTIGASATFGSITYTQSDNTPQMFIARASITGSWLWLTTTIGTGGSRVGNSLMFHDDELLVCGTNNGTSNFGTTSIVSTSNDIILAKIDITTAFPVMITTGGSRGQSASFVTIPSQYTISTINGSALVNNKTYYYHPETGLVNTQRLTSSDLTPPILVGMSGNGTFFFRPQF
jgi:hypothetical protein